MIFIYMLSKYGNASLLQTKLIKLKNVLKESIDFKIDELIKFREGAMPSDYCPECVYGPNYKLDAEISMYETIIDLVMALDIFELRK